jgi:hypothetical protein
VPRAAGSDDGPEEITRDTIKRLTKLFYYSKAGEAACVEDSRYLLMSHLDCVLQQLPATLQHACAYTADPPIVELSVYTCRGFDTVLCRCCRDIDDPLLTDR